MNLLYSDVEQEKNTWDYGEGVGYIAKSYGSSEKDAEQDQRIDSNEQAIADNESRDDNQQTQIDANTEAIARNEQLDIEQQTQIDANAQSIAQNESRDDVQQSQIDETIRRLNENIENDERQQEEIVRNTTNIIRVENELPTLEMEGTTLVISKRGDS
jgi:hypothetical protein